MFDTEKFIVEVEMRPPLYNIRSKDYSNREIKAKCWDEIGDAIYDDWCDVSLHIKDLRGKELIKKWKSIRDYFLKDHRLVTLTETGKPASKRKRYMYYDQLQFLLPHVRGKVNTSSNIDPPTGSEIDESEPNDNYEQGDIYDQHPQGFVDATETTSTMAGPSKRKFVGKQSRVSKKSAFESSVTSSAKDLTSILSESLAFQKEERQVDVYGHKTFMMSFIPILNSLPLHEAMQARLQVSQIITDFHIRSQECSNYSRNSSSGPDTPSSYQSDSEVFNISEYITFESRVN